MLSELRGSEYNVAYVECKSSLVSMVIHFRASTSANDARDAPIAGNVSPELNRAQGQTRLGVRRPKPRPGRWRPRAPRVTYPGRWRPRAPRATYPGRVCHAWQSGSHEYDRANAELVERPKEADVAEEDTKLQKEEERRRKGIIETAGDGEG